MEKINALVTAAKASEDDALHKLSFAMESIAGTIKRSVKELKEAESQEYADLTVWYLKGRIDASVQALNAIIIARGLHRTPEGEAVLKIGRKEVEEDA